MAKSYYLLDSYEDKISNSCQVGGIELSELCGGPGDGVRIAWFNTGSGLRFKVVIDRGMDIADAFMNQFGLAWISRLGVAAPDIYARSGNSWLYGLGGGLLVTCGLDHVGPAADGPRGSFPLHGRIGMLPAVLESVVQPDPLRGEYGMSIMIVTHDLGVISDVADHWAIISKSGARSPRRWALRRSWSVTA